MKYTLIVNELIKVQPMSTPAGMVFDLDACYDAIAKQLAEDVDREMLRQLERDVLGGPEEYILPKRSLKDKLNDLVARFPHTCPRCSRPAYIGLNDVECSDKDCR